MKSNPLSVSLTKVLVKFPLNLCTYQFRVATSEIVVPSSVRAPFPFSDTNITGLVAPVVMYKSSSGR